MASTITHFIVGASVALPALESKVIRKILPGWAILCRRGCWPSRRISTRSCEWFWLALIWSVSAVTHPLLDALTDGGSGVMLLFPFNDARLFFPWRPIHAGNIEVLR